MVVDPGKLVKNIDWISAAEQKFFNPFVHLLFLSRGSDDVKCLTFFYYSLIYLLFKWLIQSH